MAGLEAAYPLLVPAVLCLITLVVFIATLALKKKGEGRGKRERKALGDNLAPNAGTKFVRDEDGHVVRRSTRARKAPSAFETEGVAASPAGKTPVKRASTEAVTPAKSPAPAATPKTGRTTRASAAAQAEDASPKPVTATKARRTPRA